MTWTCNGRHRTSVLCMGDRSQLHCIALYGTTLIFIAYIANLDEERGREKEGRKQLTVDLERGRRKRYKWTMDDEVTPFKQYINDNSS